LLSRIRVFFAARQVLEVETPAISQAASSDVNLQSFTLGTEQGMRYLHTSPEYPMKRLLAAGCGDIYQVSKVFRNGETGRYHNPEFTLLEWYRVGWEASQLMDEVDALLHVLLEGRSEFESSQRLSYREAFRRYADLDPFENTTDQLRRRAEAAGLYITQPLDREQWLDLLMSQLLATAFPRDRFTFIYDYPAEQAALARIRSIEPPVAERFEIFMGGFELGNGYCELTHAGEQRERFTRELHTRSERGLETPPCDDRLLAALGHGMPDCSGVALGLDRVLMLAAGASHIEEVLAFPWQRA
jgi:lysyl-tRNA synthetase class 2